MTNYLNPAIPLSSTQLAQINSYGSAANYPAMYGYISDEYKAGRITGMESSQAYWFEQASKINANDAASAASIYIRSVTALGLGNLLPSEPARVGRTRLQCAAC